MVAQISSDYEFSSCSNPLLFLTSRFDVAESLFSNRTQNEKVVHEAQQSLSLMFLPHFDVFCDLLLYRSKAT